MKRHKWHLIIILGLVLVLMSSAAACAKSEKAVYAPDFTLPTINGESVTLSDFRGKPVMLIFWKIQCAACEFQLPFTQALYNTWSSDTIAVLTINVGDSTSAVQDYITSRGITYPVLLDRQGIVSRTYGIPGVPMTLLIDDEGILKAYKIGAFKNQQEMETAIRSSFSSFTLNPKIETSPEIGKLAPDFTLQTIDGKSTTLSAFRGKTVLLHFWVSSCPACVDEMPYFQTALDGQANEGLIILTINCGENSQTVQSAVDGIGLTFPLLLDPEGKTCTAYKRGAPTTFLIDGNGIIKAIRDEVFQSSKEIEALLNSQQ